MSDTQRRWLVILGVTGTLFLLQCGVCSGVLSNEPVSPGALGRRAPIGIVLIPQIVALIIGIVGGLFDAWRARAARFGCIGLAIGAATTPVAMWLVMRLWEEWMRAWVRGMVAGLPTEFFCCLAPYVLMVWALGYALAWHLPLVLPWIWWGSAAVGWVADATKSALLPARESNP